MSTLYRQLRCKCITKGGKICHAFLGNIEAHTDVTVQLPCHYASGHRNPDKEFLTEFSQTAEGGFEFRVIPKGNRVDYLEDDGLRVQHG